MNYWPDGMKVDPIAEWPGEATARRQQSKFDSTLSSTMETLNRELRALAAKKIRLQIAVPVNKFRLDGFPYADAKPSHPGIILTFDSKHGPLSYPSDKYLTWPENLRAIALSLEALRFVDRHGVTKRGEQYRGFLELESFDMPSGHRFEGVADAWQVVHDFAGVEYVPDTERDGKAIIRRAKFNTHIDRGGNPGDYDHVVAAEQYLSGRGITA